MFYTPGGWAYFGGFLNHQQKFGGLRKGGQLGSWQDTLQAGGLAWVTGVVGFSLPC